MAIRYLRKFAEFVRKLYILNKHFLYVFAIIINCKRADQNASNSVIIDTVSNETLTGRVHMTNPKITPCLWVETTEAKAVADYYLSTFKDGKIKEHHQYENPAEADG
ncbi:VOC family protein [Fulvivirga sp. 2943]|uniref:VOC family protein n=1 Tax=Fulvivirga sediminis TaxID=2803949 RepID=A0A937FA86_9BACT|nr:VOC family protein [Fulvivirga sediminis]